VLKGTLRVIPAHGIEILHKTGMPSSTSRSPQYTEFAPFYGYRQKFLIKSEVFFMPVISRIHFTKWQPGKTTTGAKKIF